MDRLTIFWSIAAGACAALGVAHLAVRTLRPADRRSHLLFGTGALAASLNGVAEIMMFKARTPDAFASAHRVAIAAVAVLMVSMVWYAMAFTGEGRPSLALAVTAVWTAITAIDLLAPGGVVFSRISAVRTVRTIWGEPFSVPVATFSPFRYALDVADLLMAAFLIDLFVATWRHGDRRRVLPVAVAIGFLIVAGLIQVRLVDLGLLDMPHIGSFVYIAVVTVAGYPLTADAVRVSRMAEQLRESETDLLQSRRVAELSAEEARQAEEWFRRVFDSVPTGMVLADAGGTIRLANPHAESTFGYGHGELVGLPVDALVPEELDDPGYASSGLASLASRGHGEDVRARRKDGSAFLAEVRLSPVPTGDRNYVLATVVDVSARRRSELEIARQRNELAHLSRLTTIGELAGALAHELNQPLTAILANAQAALRMLEKAPTEVGEVAEILQDIVDSDRHAGEVIGRLRAMLRKGDEKIEPLDPTEIVQDALKLARSDLLNHGVVFTADLATGLPSIDGDRVQLLQVLLNLVLNAIDAVGGKPPDRRKLSFGAGIADAGGRTVHIWVEDTGPGIPEDSVERIFEPFYTTKTGGMGLGLSVCRTIISAHGGTIHVTSRAGQGATFHVVLPAGSLVRPAADALPAPRSGKDFRSKTKV
ncbi:MAG TPA: ATP-binding protein [Thermoanaerobaculia bacterium]|nr:ATP-binding protein [Thermoanaerobaculia bacterium]